MGHGTEYDYWDRAELLDAVKDTYMKLYKKATELFLNCVLCPSKVLSAIAMEAYKKYYLTSRYFF